MTYATDFLRYVFSFMIDGTDEIAVTDLTVGPWDPTGLAPVPSGVLGDVRDAMEDFLDGVSGQRATYSTFLGVKVTALDVEGHYLLDPATIDSTGAHAGDSTNVCPQSTIVVSLRSGQTLGKGNYGRLFVPHSGYPQAGPYLSPSTQTGWATLASEFIANVNSAHSAMPLSPVVRIMSQAEGTPNKPVQRVDVGRLVDTQRRRRNALSEDYVSATV